MRTAKVSSQMNTPKFAMKHASITLGAFFCMFISACGEENSTATADWENKVKTATTESPTPVATEHTEAKPNSPTAKDGVRFLSYNLRNYLVMRRYSDGESSYRGKPESEIEPLLKVIVEGNPDILGICEIGSPKDLADFQKRLAAKGIDLPHTHHVKGSDKVRSLAILSKFPVRPHAKPEDSNYELEGKEFFIGRGILDASITAAGKDIRFLGVHLKSKRPIKEADQEMMRRNEAALLRKHIDQILKADKKANLVVYGDFNDTKRTKTVYSVKGRGNSSIRLEILDPADSRGELWTHHWEREDIYSRIDYCMVSLGLEPHIDREASKLLDPKYWAIGSDHRAMLVVIR